MPGRVVALLATSGQPVSKGEPLLILEAMKMAHTIHAPADGTVNAFYFGAGKQVCDGDELLDFDGDSRWKHGVAAEVVERRTLQQRAWKGGVRGVREAQQARPAEAGARRLRR